METLITRPFFQKLTNLDVFRLKAIRRIKMAIRHMWRVANGLDNTALVGTACVLDPHLYLRLYLDCLV